jgi:hypothetical protein
MNIQHMLQRFFIIITVLLCIGLALLFGALQAGLI